MQHTTMFVYVFIYLNFTLLDNIPQNSSKAGKITVMLLKHVDGTEAMPEFILACFKTSHDTSTVKNVIIIYLNAKLYSGNVLRIITNYS